MNLLVAGDPQIMTTGRWLAKLGIAARDTGNAMDEKQVMHLSQAIAVDALLAYRLAVGRKTQKIIRALEPCRLKSKVEFSRLQQIRKEGAVVEGENWLIEYWGNRTIAGLLLMPATRHLFVHLNECARIKEKIKRGGDVKAN